eukprot:3043106-Rhodomonas_salina.1
MACFSTPNKAQEATSELYQAPRTSMQENRNLWYSNWQISRQSLTTVALSEDLTFWQRDGASFSEFLLVLKSWLFVLRTHNVSSTGSTQYQLTPSKHFRYCNCCTAKRGTRGKGQGAGGEENQVAMATMAERLDAHAAALEVESEVDAGINARVGAW